jgi:hypothetical protein
VSWSNFPEIKLHVYDENIPALNSSLKAGLKKQWLKCTGKLPQKQYGLKIDKLFNFKTVKDEKKHLQSCSDRRHSQRI